MKTQRLRNADMEDDQCSYQQEHGYRDIVVCDADLEDIIPGYLENRKAECHVIGEMANQGAFDEIRSLAHGLKGSGGCYGFGKLSDIGGAMEAAAKNSQRDEVLTQLVLLAAYLECIEVRYE